MTTTTNPLAAPASPPHASAHVCLLYTLLRHGRGLPCLMAGLVVLSAAHSYPLLLVGAALLGMGSSVFHPEASRIAHAAAGGKRGLAQSVFQLGGTFGSSLGPLLAALIVVPYGLRSLGWFAIVPLVAA